MLTENLFVILSFCHAIRKGKIYGSRWGVWRRKSLLENMANVTLRLVCYFPENQKLETLYRTPLSTEIEFSIPIGIYTTVHFRYPVFAI
jgi:hypothetical protein